MPSIIETQTRKKPKVNKVPMVVIRGQWTSETFKETMDVIEKQTWFLCRDDRSWNIPLSFLCDHLNGETKSKKMGLGGLLGESMVKYGEIS
jgi:hypothetical protein